MRRLVILTFFVLFLLMNVALAQTPCERRNPAGYFDGNIDTVEYVRTESAQNLTQWQRGHNALVGSKVLGVGGGQIGTKLTVLYTLQQVGDKLYCLYPKQVKANFYASPKIHIASNYARGSCEYSEVLVHEQKHLNVLKKFYREYKPQYRDEFQRVIRHLPDTYPITIEEAEEAKSNITGTIMAGLNDYTQIMMDELNARQRVIDSPEEYERVLSKCDNWQKKLNR